MPEITNPDEFFSEYALLLNQSIQGSTSVHLNGTVLIVDIENSIKYYHTTYLLGTKDFSNINTPKDLLCKTLQEYTQAIMRNVLTLYGKDVQDKIVSEKD